MDSFKAEVFDFINSKKEDFVRRKPLSVFDAEFPQSDFEDESSSLEDLTRDLHGVKRDRDSMDGDEMPLTKRIAMDESGDGQIHRAKSEASLETEGEFIDGISGMQMAEEEGLEGGSGTGIGLLNRTPGKNHRAGSMSGSALKNQITGEGDAFEGEDQESGEAERSEIGLGDELSEFKAESSFYDEPNQDASLSLYNQEDFATVLHPENPFHLMSPTDAYPQAAPRSQTRSPTAGAYPPNPTHFPIPDDEDSAQFSFQDSNSKPTNDDTEDLTNTESGQVEYRP